ncbi:hypothetical protein ABT256_28000 [Amycolatopsis japonica]|uniref:hypothetical protein n=1 Tax=Amycolatopsis japonica TaxID=208439 RepID=UPI0033201479
MPLVTVSNTLYEAIVRQNPAETEFHQTVPPALRRSPEPRDAVVLERMNSPRVAVAQDSQRHKTTKR